MYEGEWKENMREGDGIYHFKNGRIYKGQFKNNNIDGYGEFTWPEGKKYYGFYKNDKKDGFGIYYWPGGKFFVGFFKDEKQHGISKYLIKTEKNIDIFSEIQLKFLTPIFLELMKLPFFYLFLLLFFL